MRRLFPILAVVAGLLLARDLLDRPGPLAVAATLAAHGSAFVYLAATGRRVEGWSKDREWPDWVAAQAEKNRRKAIAYQGWGSAILGLSAWSGPVGRRPMVDDPGLGLRPVVPGWGVRRGVRDHRRAVEVGPGLRRLGRAAPRPPGPGRGLIRPGWEGELPTMSPLGLVVSIVLVDLLGFSLVMPLLAPFAKEYGFSPLQIGLLIAGYPMAQLVAGPILGRLSDRFGRRPVLAASQFGTAASFLILGLSTDFTVMFLARLLDGASGGNILVAQAYVADVTKPEDRSRGYGLIGMAFGLGFVLGPLLGLALVELPVPSGWRLRIPFLVASGFSTIAWVLVLLRLPESLPKDSKARQSARVATLRGLADAFRLPGVGRMIALGSLVALGFAALEATFSLYLGERQGWGPAGVMAGFTYVGVVTAIVQGGMVRRLVPKYGEARLIVVGLVLLTLGFVGLAVAIGTASTLLATLFVAVGQGFVSPTVTGLLSRITPEGERGAVFGTLSSSQTLARMANYVLANLLFGRGNTASPFWEAAAITLAALALAAVTLPTARRLADRAEPVEELDAGEPVPSGAV